jgi:AcrR family transcriptional regulator
MTEITDHGASRTGGADDVAPTEEGPRRLRADAERNRRRLLDAATEMFCERGLEVGVGEIAQRAGVGRGTLFRNFPSKEDLIAAIVVERMEQSLIQGRALVHADDPGEALFTLLDQAMTRSETDRALFEALDDEWLCRAEIGAVHAELLSLLEVLVHRAQDAGAVRADVGAVDVIILVKGVCEASRSLRHLDPDFGLRQRDLVRAAICAPGHERPLRGRPPTVQEFKRAHDPAPVPVAAGVVTA